MVFGNWGRFYVHSLLIKIFLYFVWVQSKVLLDTTSFINIVLYFVCKQSKLLLLWRRYMPNSRARSCSYDNGYRILTCAEYSSGVSHSTTANSFVFSSTQAVYR